MPGSVDLLPDVRGFLERDVPLIIDGATLASLASATFDVEDPSTRRIIGGAARGQAGDVDRAVEAAHRAFRIGTWPSMSPSEREALLRKLAEVVLQHSEELAQLESLDSGKPIWLSRQEIKMGADAIYYYSGWPTKLYGETSRVKSDLLAFSLREPVGVCGAVTPWNFPFLMAVWKIAPAITFGNTVVLKPAEETPLTAVRFGQLCLEAGVPPGVVNVVTGLGEEAGAALVAHPKVDKVAFTGSTEIGRAVMRAASEGPRRISLELGGKSPCIVFADADLKRASFGSMLGVFTNSGQMCTAGSRVFVERSIHEAFIEAFSSAVARLPLGMPFDSSTRLGPLVSQRQLERVSGYVNIGLSEGAEVAHSGTIPTHADSGYFFEPTLLIGVDNKMRVAQEEIFGPVAAVIPFDDAEEVIRLGNETEYGLAASVWTGDISKAHRVARDLRSGTVWVNTTNLVDPSVSFGGYKRSGFGRELGLHSLELYTDVKSVWVQQ